MVADLRQGSELAGYRIQVLLARGGMGVVYRATQLSLERQVALKVVAPDLAEEEEFRRRFLREVRVAASLDHPHVLPVYEAGEVDGVLYLAMRFVEGESLAEVLAREGALEPVRACAIVSQVAEALAAAHEAGLVHRDVKPQNVLLARAGAREHAYLCDFGVARRSADATALTKTGGFVGSVTYAAPEQIKGESVDARTDLYALGCLLYECLTGEPPFPNEHEAAVLWAHLNEPPPLPSDTHPSLGESFDGIVERALAKDPGERFSSAAAFVTALASDTPAAAWRPVAAAKTNLPTPASSFLGRERELQELGALLARDDVRLLTLTGPGGTGKTRLALEAASSLVPEYKAGVFWVGLASLRDPALVTETIAQTLGAKDGLAEHISERELLLLLDNLEQVIDSALELSALLQSCPNLTLLVTSRELLRVQGEVEYPVPPLAEPEAVSLFCERARLEPTEEIAELCARLDSLPLAVELAAARTKALTPAQILARLSSRLNLLKGGRDADPRQQTLRATIEWSYELLAPEEQVLFARLSVFAGGCTLEAAEEVADADLDTLQSLVEKSLLRFTDERYWMLETIREYATERLTDAGEASESRERHAHHLLELTASADERVQSADAVEVLAALDREIDNIRAASSWLVESRQGGPQLELVAQVWRYWVIRGALHEGLRWVTFALAASEGEENRERAIALRVAAVLTRMLGDLDAAEAYGVESLQMRRRLGDPEEIAHGLSLLASVAADREDYVSAQQLYEEAAALGRGGETQTRAMLSGSLADVALRQRDYLRALTLAEESLWLFRKLARDDGAAWALFTIALSLFRLDREDDAVVPARESLELAHAIVEVENIVWALLLLGAIDARRGEVLSAARLVGAAEAIRGRSGLMLSGAEVELHETAIYDLRAGLSPGAFDGAFAEAQMMTLDEAVEYALASIH